MQMEGSVSADKILSRRYHKKISELWHYCTISFNSAVAHHRPSKMAEMSQSSWSISSGAKIIWQTCAIYRNFFLPAALNGQKFFTACYGATVVQYFALPHTFN